MIIYIFLTFFTIFLKYRFDLLCFKNILFYSNEYIFLYLFPKKFLGATHTNFVCVSFKIKNK